MNNFDIKDLIYVDTSAKLENFVTKALNCEFVCFDTEFIRESRYYPKLCLIQAQVETSTYIIDPFKVSDITPLERIFVDRDVVKVFHSAGQDLEVFYNELKIVPRPFFDTQIAASIVGGFNQPGLANLLSQSLSIKISKSEGFSDWSARPLSDEQLKYAAEDVIYLPELYQYQTTFMKENGREHWLDDEFKKSVSVSNFVIDPYERYIHLRHVSRLTAYQLCLARELAAWREISAAREDVVRKRIISDDQICEICRRDPNDIESLYSVRGLKNTIKIQQAREILGVLNKGRNVNYNDWPTLNNTSSNEENVDEALNLMNAIVRLRASQNGVSTQILASNSQLSDLARGKFDDSPLLKGWRKDIVGDELVRLIEGKLSLSLDDNRLVIHHID